MKTRRALLRCAGLGSLLLAGAAVQWPALASTRPRLALLNLHTGERAVLDVPPVTDWPTDLLSIASRVLRDHRSGEIHPIDPGLLGQLAALQNTLGLTGPFHVISGYRAPATNARLAESSGGVARRSLHMQGRAVDVRLPGRPLRELHQAALTMRAGGVGYYATSNFIHLDTGRVRNW